MVYAPIVRKALKMARQNILTSEQLAIFKEIYPTTKNKELAEMFNVSVNFVARKARDLGIKKCPLFISNNQKNNNKGQFKKGLIPHNKGQKLSEDVKQKLQKTMFKKGNKPQNTKQIGDEIIDSDGYTLVKVSDSKIKKERWRLKHHIAFGEPIPKDMILIFIDGNKQNFDKSNLKLITKAENMKKNTIYRYPAELINLIRTSKKLSRKIAEVQNA